MPLVLAELPSPSSRRSGRLRSAMLPVGEDSEEDLSAPQPRTGTLTAEALSLLEQALIGEELGQRLRDPQAVSSADSRDLAAKSSSIDLQRSRPAEAEAEREAPAEDGSAGVVVEEPWQDLDNVQRPTPSVLEDELAAARPTISSVSGAGSKPAPRIQVAGRSLGRLSARVLKPPGAKQRPTCILTERAEAYEAAQRELAGEDEFPPRQRMLRPVRLLLPNPDLQGGEGV